MTDRQNILHRLCIKACNRDNSWRTDLASFCDDDLTQELKDTIERIISSQYQYLQFGDANALLGHLAAQPPNIIPTKFTGPAAASRLDKTLLFFTPTIKFGENTSVSPNIVCKDNIPTRFTLKNNAQWHTAIGQEPVDKRGISAFIVKIINRGSHPSAIKIGITRRKISGEGSAALGNGHYLQSAANAAVMGPKLNLHNGHVNDDAALGLPSVATQGVTYVTVIVNTNSLGSIRYLLDGREVDQHKQPFLFPQHFEHEEGQTEWRPCVSFWNSDAVIEFVRAQEELPAYFNSFFAHNYLVEQTRRSFETFIFTPAKKFEDALSVSAENGKTFGDKLKLALNGVAASVFLSSPSGQGKTTLRNFSIDVLNGRHATGNRTTSPAAGTAQGQASLAPDCYTMSDAFKCRHGFWDCAAHGDMYINDLVGLETEPTQYKDMFRAYIQGRLGESEPFPSVRDFPGDGDSLEDARREVLARDGDALEDARREVLARDGDALDDARREVLARDVADKNAHATCIIFPIAADSIFQNNNDAVAAFTACREMCQTINRHPLHITDKTVRDAADRVPGGVKQVPYKVVVTKIFSKFPELPRNHLLNPQYSPFLQVMYQKLTREWNIDINDIVVIGGLNNTSDMDFTDSCDGNKDPEIIVVRQLLLDVARASAAFLIPKKEKKKYC